MDLGVVRIRVTATVPPPCLLFPPTSTCTLRSSEAAWEHPPTSRATTGSKALQPPPFPKERPVGVLAGKGEAAVAEAQQPALLVVDVGGVAPADLPVLDLQLVEEPGVHSPLLGLGAALWTGTVHGRWSKPAGPIPSAWPASQIRNLSASIISSFRCTHACLKTSEAARCPGPIPASRPASRISR